MPRSKVELRRLRISKLLAVVWFLMAASVTSYWDEDSPIGLTLFLTGSVLVGIGVLGRVWCLSVISGRKDKSLIVSGPYSLCRNPLYLFSLLATIGVGLATATFIVPVIAIIGFLIYYPLVIRSEERRLAELFGSTFEEYRKTTPRLIPKVGHAVTHLRSAEIDGLAFFKGMADCFWFLFAFAVLHLFAELHDLGVLPNSLHLP